MTLILALGTPLRGDDGAAIAVLRQLAQAALPTDVTLVESSTPGLETALLLRDDPRLIIIDTCQMGLPPGSWWRFKPEALPPGDPHTLNINTISEALALAAALGRMPHDITIYAIEPEKLDWETRLTPLVQAVVPVVAWAVWQQITEMSEAIPQEMAWG